MQLRYVFTMAFGALGLISNADGYLIDPESVSKPTHVAEFQPFYLIKRSVTDIIFICSARGVGFVNYAC